MGFFKAYDMRGSFGTDFDLDTVFRVGKALPKVVSGGRWLVGRDCRVTSPDVAAALVAGLRESGAEVTDLGLCTTPMVYFFTAEDGYDGSVMVTASHNPPSDNGLKVSSAGARPVGYANGLDRVEKLVLGTDPTERPFFSGLHPSRHYSRRAEAIAMQATPTRIEVIPHLPYGFPLSAFPFVMD